MATFLDDDMILVIMSDCDILGMQHKEIYVQRLKEVDKDINMNYREREKETKFEIDTVMDIGEVKNINEFVGANFIENFKIPCRFELTKTEPNYVDYLEKDVFVVLYDYKMEFYSVYKETNKNGSETITRKIKQITLKVKALKLCTSSKYKLVGILGQNGEIMICNMFGKFIGSVRHPSNTSLNEHNKEKIKITLINKILQSKVKSIYAFTSLFFGEDKAFIGVKSSEILIYSLPDFELKTSISNLGAYKGSVYSVEELVGVETDEILFYQLSDCTNGVLKFSKNNVNILAKSIVDSGFCESQQLDILNELNKEQNFIYDFCITNINGCITRFNKTEKELRFTQYQVLTGLYNEIDSHNSNHMVNEITASHYAQFNEFEENDKFIYLGTRNGIIAKFSLDYERREYVKLIQDCKVCQIESLYNKGVLLIIGMSSNSIVDIESDNIPELMTVCIYREINFKGNNLTKLKEFKNYKFTSFHLYQIMDGTVSLILNKEKYYYRFDFDNINKDINKDESQDKDSSSDLKSVDGEGILEILLFPFSKRIGVKLINCSYIGEIIKRDSNIEIFGTKLYFIFRGTFEDNKLSKLSEELDSELSEFITPKKGIQNKIETDSEIENESKNEDSRLMFDQRMLNDSNYLKQNLAQTSNFIDKSLSSSRLKETHRRVIITPKQNKVQFQKYEDAKSRRLIGSSYPDEFDVTTVGIDNRYLSRKQQDIERDNLIINNPIDEVKILRSGLKQNKRKPKELGATVVYNNPKIGAKVYDNRPIIMNTSDYDLISNQMVDLSYSTTDEGKSRLKFINEEDEDE